MGNDQKGLQLLTAQEKKVLKLVVEAKANKEIAAALGISPSTVKRHLENLLSKLRLKNRVAAAVYAVRRGDCPPETHELKKAA
jgi:two-component system nitrate/nitrite response regulator NarL